MMKLIGTIALMLTAAVLSASEMVIIISDSTAVDYRGKKNAYNQNKVGWSPMSGWGEFAADAAGNQLRVLNRSAGGFSSKTYWEKQQRSTRKYFKKDAWLLLSFGSNDARYSAADPGRNTTADGTFMEYMNKIASEAKAAGMKVVIISPVPFYSMADGKFSNTVLQPYAQASEKLARANNYAYVDLFGMMSKYFSTMSDEEIRTHYMFIAPGASPNWPRGRKDPLHLTDKGSRKAWEFILAGLKKEVPELAKLFK